MDPSWIEQWLSPERFAPFAAHCGGDIDLALSLYDWNAALSQALFRDISYFEICLRNTYSRVLDDRWNGTEHWLFDPTSPLLRPVTRSKNKRGIKALSNINYINQKNIREATHRAGGSSAAPGKIIAELSLGFWASLTTSSREQFLWTPYLRFAFPKGTNRATIHQNIEIIRKIRNRIAHNEPIYYQISTPNWNYDPANFPTLLFNTFSLLSDQASSHTKKSSSFLQILGSRPKGT